MWSPSAKAIIAKQIQRMVFGEVDHATARAEAIQSLKHGGE
jgi:hypothetical protein